jgi:hypothetical protein
VVGVERTMSVSERFAAAVGRLLERKLSRRSALSRAALAGSAFAVAPVRYMIRPGTAWAVLRPENCRSGLCTDGYTAFCCEIQRGNNTCPAGTYVAGWWKCAAYRGHGLCSDAGVRYYIDCNRMPGSVFPGGCQCANGNCANRRVDCNHFRYGQCNTQILGTTEVVCRLVICQHPATVPGMNCNATLKTDNQTCAHEANCLKGLVVQPPAEGGA